MHNDNNNDSNKTIFINNNSIYQIIKLNYNNNDNINIIFISNNNKIMIILMNMNIILRTQIIT